jgi:hypothetical protein
MSLCTFAIPFAIRLPTLKISLPIPKIPFISLELPEFDLSLRIPFELPSLKISLPIPKLPWITLPPCPLDAL